MSTLIREIQPRCISKILHFPVYDVGQRWKRGVTSTIGEVSQTGCSLAEFSSCLHVRCFQIEGRDKKFLKIVRCT